MLVETLGSASGVMDPSELPQEDMDEPEEEEGSEEEMEDDEDGASGHKEVSLTEYVTCFEDQRSIHKYRPEFSVSKNQLLKKTKKNTF